MGAVSYDHGDRFHQDISILKRGTVKNGVQILWLATAEVVMETPTGEYKRLRRRSECVMNSL